MSEPIQTTIDVLGNAANVVIAQGVLGSLVVLEFAVIVCLAWLLLRSRNKHMAILERMAIK